MLHVDIIYLASSGGRGHTYATIKWFSIRKIEYERLHSLFYGQRECVGLSTLSARSRESDFSGERPGYTFSSTAAICFLLSSTLCRGEGLGEGRGDFSKLALWPLASKLVFCDLLSFPDLDILSSITVLLDLSLEFDRWDLSCKLDLWGLSWEWFLVLLSSKQALACLSSKLVLCERSSELVPRCLSEDTEAGSDRGELHGELTLGLKYSCWEEDCEALGESLIPSNWAASCLASTPWFDLTHFSDKIIYTKFNETF